MTREHIESVIATLPLQGRVMLHLLMLQYFDVPHEEIEYIAADRPDPRLQAGAKPLHAVISREALDSITARVEQYRSAVRQRRERYWLQSEYLRRQITRTETLSTIAARLLTERFGFSPDQVREWKTTARTAVPKPMIRELEARWEQNEIGEEEYRGRRLAIEYQTLLRRLERDRKRLDVTKREFETASLAPLQDHEIAHIWGIPNSTLTARKVKYLQQFLQGLQAALVAADPGAACPNLWKEAFLVLSRGPVQRSVAAYDGLEHTEEALLAKLSLFASGAMPDDLESRSWPIVSRSLFALQRLSAIQNEWELSPDTLEQELLDRIAPAPKEPVAELEGDKPVELGEMGEHVLRSMMGEERRL
ncbi:hypothetical protein [Candidatus Nitrospira bockiana]